MQAQDLAARIDQVREDTRRSEKNIILHNGAGPQRDIVLDLHVVTDFHMTGNDDVLPEHAFLTDLRMRHDMAEMPDHRAFANFTGNIDVRGWVNVVVDFHVRLSSVWDLPGERRVPHSGSPSLVVDTMTHF